jgi:multidrug efflux pump subunit AcrB
MTGLMYFMQRRIFMVVALLAWLLGGLLGSAPTPRSSKPKRPLTPLMWAS